jgi:hypothetical protein
MSRWRCDLSRHLEGVRLRFDGDTWVDIELASGVIGGVIGQLEVGSVGRWRAVGGRWWAFENLPA